MAKKSKKNKKLPKSRSVDFSGVSVGGRRKIPTGDYKFSITDIEENEGDAGPYWKIISEVVEGKHKGFRDFSNYSFSAKALWRLRQLLEAVGLDPGERKLKLDPKDLIGMEFGGSVEDETYQGKTRSRIADVFTIDDIGESEEEDDDDEETDDSEDDEDEEDEDDDEEVDDEEDEEEEEEKSKKKRKKSKS